MATPVDLNEDEEIINRHILLSKELFDLAMKDAKKRTTGNLSMWIRMVLREYYGIKEKN